MNLDEFPALAERLRGSSDEERFALLEQASQSDELRSLLREAHLVLTGADQRTRAVEPEEPAETSLALSRGRVSRAAVAEWDTVEWILASLASLESSSIESTPRASRATRRAVRAMVRTRPTRRGWHRAWVPAIGVAAVAAVVLLLMLTPATEPWARELDLSRWRVLRLSGELAATVKGAVETGQLAEPLFQLPAGPGRRERDAIAAGLKPPQALSPRWEAVGDLRPAFRWSTTQPDAGSEVLLLDSDRKLVWSATLSQGDELPFPDEHASLEPGRDYYWKINRLGDERLLPSAYVAFRTLDPAQRGALHRDLGRAGGQPFLRGSVLDRHGLYSAASEAFGQASDLDAQRAIALRARAAVRAKQDLAE